MPDIERAIDELRVDLARTPEEQAHAKGRYVGPYDGLRTFADVKAMLNKVPTQQALCALNDAVEARFMRDQQQLAMTDSDWDEYSFLVARRASQLEHRDDGAPHSAS